ncbi:hypothetical protein SAMN04488567_3721 [Limimaricola pyoseonensis]|uniref:Uncharacterized protein n=1 Tax=Limimaricola pyoseonensis TaxID=521013 RepID=A0A1G7JGY1_9RHOB|nr:hypothetical protein SAMN04488567_3721 [Limimaricola pyoseonensis]
MMLIDISFRPARAAAAHGHDRTPGTGGRR